MTKSFSRRSDKTPYFRCQRYGTYKPYDDALFVRKQEKNYNFYKKSISHQKSRFDSKILRSPLFLGRFFKGRPPQSCRYKDKEGGGIESNVNDCLVRQIDTINGGILAEITGHSRCSTMLLEFQVCVPYCNRLFFLFFSSFNWCFVTLFKIKAYRNF